MPSLTNSSPSPHRQGRAEPTKSAYQDADYSEGSACLQVAESAGLRLLEWQRLIIDRWLGVTDGRWASKTCGLSVPRQNGKTLGVIDARCAYGLIVKNEQVLYTAHLQKTSTETFEEMRALFETKALRKYVKVIRTALGRESIELKSGARIKFLARTRNGGRGQHCDLLIYDEAQELTDEQQASFTPCLSASSNPQTVYAGTPPDESAPGVVFRRIRDRALSGFPGRAWTEWSVDEIGDPHDKSRWYETNPSLGILILEESVESESIDFAADKFARERLGWWQPVISDVPTVIDAEQWALCETDDPPFEGELFVGVKAGLDVTSLSVCIKPVDGVPYVEWVGSHPASDGIGWIATWLTKRRDEIGSVGIDGRTASEALVQRLARLGFPKSACKAYGASDIVKATSLFVNAVSDAQVSHYGQQELTDSATKTERRTVGGGFAFQDAAGADATIVESCAIAYRQAASSKGKPKGMRIG